MSPTVLASVALVVASIIVLGPGQRTASAVACPQTLHDGFTSASADGLTLNGSATITGGNLRLTNSSGQSAAAWSTSTVSLLGDASFSTSFTLKFSNPIGGGADGIVFAVQTQSNSAGGLGGGLGYAGITPSIAIEFDDFQNADKNDPDNHHMAIDLNGSVDHGSPVPAGRLFTTSTNFFDTGTWYVWVDYNGVTKRLEGRISTTTSRPASAQVSIVDDLPVRLSTTSAFIGFTGATGGSGGTHEILRWRFFPCYNPNPDGTAQSITFAALADRTLADASTFGVSATASSGLAVSFSSATTSVCTVSGTTVTVLTTGTCSIIASQPGDSTFAAADPVTRSFTVSKVSQTITFGALSDRTLADASTFGVSATASSGLAVSFSSATTSVCSVSGTTVTVLGLGTCTLTASQAGNSTYAAATDVSRSFSVTKVAQTITFAALPDLRIDDSPPALSATASSGLAATFASATPSACTVSGTTLTLVRVGTCTVTASQAGNSTYSAASDVSRSFTVRAPSVAQAITFGPLRDRTMLEQPFTVSANASSGLPVSITTGTPGVCTISGGWVTLVSAGTCTLTASQGGSVGDYLSASLSRSFAVTKATQTIDAISGLDTAVDHAVGEAPATLSGSASSGLPVAFAAVGACVLSQGVLSFPAEGTCTLTASQPGNATYLAAADLVRTFKVRVLRPPVVLLPAEPAPPPAPEAAPAAASPARRQSACGPVPTGAVGFAGLEGYHSAWAGESAFLVARPGQPLEYCLVLRNIGTLPWLSGTRATQINLGANAPQDSTAYVDAGLIVSDLYDRNRFATAQEGVVRPGEYATFVVKVRAPLTPGITRVDMAPVIDGVQWLEDEGIYFLIHVR